MAYQETEEIRNKIRELKRDCNESTSTIEKEVITQEIKKLESNVRRVVRQRRIARKNKQKEAEN